MMRSKAGWRVCGLAVGMMLVGGIPAWGQMPAPAATQPVASVSLKYSFGGAREGFEQVAPDAMYSADKGAGWDWGSRAGAGEGCVVSEGRPLFFSAKVPEGFYRVTVTLGDAKGEGHTTVRAEGGRVMFAEVATKAGETVKKTFMVSVQRPNLPDPPKNAPGYSIVHMFLPTEAGARRWDEKLSIEFNGPHTALSAIEIETVSNVPTVFVAGDSTVGDPHQGHGGNWPLQICQYFKPEVIICNNAEGGETTKSFLTGARLDKVLSQMKPGDYFLIQFGHNDSKPQWPQSYTEPETTFKAYLKVYLEEVKRKGGTLVLVTPMERRANGDSVGPWARAMKEFGAAEHVAVIDQWTESKKLWTALGDKVGSAFADQTHLSGYGGYLLSKVVVDGIRREVPGLAKFVNDDFKPLDLTAVDGPPPYLSQPAGAGRMRDPGPTAQPN